MKVWYLSRINEGCLLFLLAYEMGQIFSSLTDRKITSFCCNEITFKILSNEVHVSTRWIFIRLEVSYLCHYFFSSLHSENLWSLLVLICHKQLSFFYQSGQLSVSISVSAVLIFFDSQKFHRLFFSFNIMLHITIPISFTILNISRW